MKKAILAVVIAAISTAVVAGPGDDVIDQINKLRAQNNAQPVYKYPRFQCDTVMMDERTGKKYRANIPTYGEEVGFTDSEKTYIYHEEDDTGGSSVFVDKKSLTAEVNYTDETGKTFQSGHGKCKRVN